MKVGRNLIIGLASNVWTSLLGLIVVPHYLALLGQDAYGLVGIAATLQNLFLLLDLGLAQTINREVARCSASGERDQARDLLHTLAVVYWATGTLIALAVATASRTIAVRWLNSESLPVETVTYAVILMGVMIASRWPVGLYSGAVIGSHRMETASLINACMTTLGNAGAVVVLTYAARSIYAFFLWQSAIGLLHAFVMRRAAWRALGPPRVKRFERDALHRIWTFSQGMTGVTLTALVLTQLDKAVLSRLLSLREFGQYTLAAVVGRTLYLFVGPLFNVIYPRFSALVATGDEVALTRWYRTGSNLLATLLFPLAMALALIPRSLVQFWTGDGELAKAVASTVSLVVIAAALNGVMYFPYALQLSYGMSRMPLLINCILIVLLVPLTLLLTISYGMVGGALAGVALNVLYLLLGTWMTHRTLLRDAGWPWIARDVGTPLLVSSVLGFVARAFDVGEGPNLLTNVGTAAGLGTLAMALSLASSPHPIQQLIRQSNRQ